MSVNVFVNKKNMQNGSAAATPTHTYTHTHYAAIDANGSGHSD